MQHLVLHFFSTFVTFKFFSYFVFQRIKNRIFFSSTWTNQRFVRILVDLFFQGWFGFSCKEILLFFVSVTNIVLLEFSLQRFTCIVLLCSHQSILSFLDFSFQGFLSLSFLVLILSFFYFPFYGFLSSFFLVTIYCSFWVFLLRFTDIVLFGPH